jgi:hypothetical protein
MEFLKSSELTLNPAGYLVSKTSKKPVTLESFVKQQQNAEYIVKLASAIKGKTFKVGKTDDLEAIKASVREEIYTSRVINYVEAPNKPTSKVKDELVKFALDFVQYEEDKSKVSNINTFMNQFNSINDVETVGDYFSEGLVKLNKIYTIKEIQEAVETNIEILG